LTARIRFASLPERPIARPPAALMLVTSCLLMEPDSTISTISTVAASGDAEAIDEAALDLEPLQHLADLWPAAMHNDGIDAHLLQQHHVAGKARTAGDVAHGVAAVLHHDRLAGIAAEIRERFREDGGAGSGDRRSWVTLARLAGS